MELNTALERFTAKATSDGNVIQIRTQSGSSKTGESAPASAGVQQQCACKIQNFKIITSNKNLTCMYY